MWKGKDESEQGRNVQTIITKQNLVSPHNYKDMWGDMKRNMQGK